MKTSQICSFKRYRPIGNEREFINDLCMTFSGHFFTMCVPIFHKTEVLTVILRCRTCQNLDWVKSYGLRCNLSLCASSANSKKIEADKLPFLDHIWPLFCKLHTNLSQNWDSEGHFEVLNNSKPELEQKIWQKTQKRK